MNDALEILPSNYFDGCLSDPPYGLSFMGKACYDAKAIVLKFVEHSFYPRGYSAVVIIGESHAAIHTFPEEQYAEVDYVSCARHPNIRKFKKAFEKFNFKILEESSDDEN